METAARAGFNADANRQQSSINIHHICGPQRGDHARLMTAAFKLRHDVFVDERGWTEVAKPDGLETDQFDTDSAQHLILTEGNRVAAYSRLLPTTEPHLLSDVYPYLSAQPIPRSPAIYEWTRYCVAKEKRGETAIGNIGSLMLFTVLRAAWEQGIEHLTMQTDPVWITRFFDLGFPVTPLGLPTELAGEPVIAMQIELSSAGLSRCRRLLRIAPIMARIETVGDSPKL